MIASAPKSSQSLPAEEPLQPALDFYNAELRSQMEAHYSGQYIAIHSDTHDYVVEQYPGKAFKEMKAKYPEGSIVVHLIGCADAGLRARMSGEWSR